MDTEASLTRFIWGGCQSPHIFDESAARWIGARLKYEQVVFFLADADHVGSTANKESVTARYDISKFYSAIFHYFPFFGKLAKVDYQSFLKQFSIPKKLGHHVLSPIKDDIFIKKEKLFLMPKCEREDTIRTVDINGECRGILKGFYDAIFSDIEKMLTTQEQYARLQKIIKTVQFSFDDLTDFATQQYDRLLQLLDINEKVTVNKMTDYFCANKSAFVTMIDSFIENYSTNVEHYNQLLREYKLSYRTLDKEKGELPFVVISAPKFKRKGLTIECYKQNEPNSFFVARHGFLIASFSKINPKFGSVYLSGVENTLYHKLTPHACEMIDCSADKTSIKYQSSIFFSILEKLSDRIKTPAWLWSEVDEVEKLGSFIKKINHLISQGEKNLQEMAQLGNFNDLLVYCCDADEISQYCKMKEDIKFAASNDERTQLWNKFWEYQGQLLQKSFYYWVRQNHYCKLARFRGRGAHLIWLYIISGERAAKEYIEKVRSDLP